jgi:hypothetical protein
MPPSIAPKVLKVGTTIQVMFTSIIINRENFNKMSVTLSKVREAEDSQGNKFNYYWLTINGMICCTGKKFTAELGADADDAKAAEVIKANEGKFQISQATDEDGDPIYIQDDPDRPLLKIQAVAHSVTFEW